MNTEQIKDMHLLYNAVYNEELREQFEEYNNTVYDEDIVEVATEYFYSYGLNADGIDILIENVGLESFVEYVYELSEDLYVLTEERKARKRTGGESYAEVKAKIDAKEAAKRKVSTAATEKREAERKEPESRGAESEAKTKQPKSKKPERKSIADRISNAIKAGVDRHNTATATAGRLAGETGKTLGKLAKGVGHVAGQFGTGAGTVAKASKKAVVGEEVEAWVNSLVEEGYDLSEYTWEEMYEAYLNEERRDPRGRVASGPMSVYGGRGTPSPDPEGDDNISRMDRAQRRVKRTQPRAKGMAADSLFTRYSARQKEMEHGDQPSPSDRTAKGHPHSPARGGRKGRGANTDRGKGNAAKRRMSEDFDLFDTILEYLVAEGYADTNESALVIMVNMSEGWRESIVEGYEPVSDNATEAMRRREASLRPGAYPGDIGDNWKKSIKMRDAMSKAGVKPI